MVMGISGIKIDMPSDVKVSIFTDNDLTHINDDHFEINLVARLLNQIHVPVPPPGCDYDDSHANVMDELTPGTYAGATASAPPFHPQHEYIFYIYRIIRYNFICIYKIISELVMIYLYLFCIMELNI